VEGEEKEVKKSFCREKGEEPLRSHLKLVFFSVQERKSIFSVCVFDGRMNIPDPIERLHSCTVFI
jgi:hypothetical protein